RRTVRAALFNAIRRDWRPLFGRRGAPCFSALGPAWRGVLLPVTLAVLSIATNDRAVEAATQPVTLNLANQELLVRRDGALDSKQKESTTCDKVSLVTCRNNECPLESLAPLCVCRTDKLDTMAVQWTIKARMSSRWSHNATRKVSSQS